MMILGGLAELIFGVKPSVRASRASQSPSLSRTHPGHHPSHPHRLASEAKLDLLESVNACVACRSEAALLG